MLLLTILTLIALILFVVSGRLPGSRHEFLGLSGIQEHESHGHDKAGCAMPLRAQDNGSRSAHSAA